MNLYEKYYLNEEIKKKLLSEAIVVFDTSALLDLYYYSNETKTEILDNVFEKLKDRLWLPAQVKFEFLKNREQVCEKPINTYRNLLKVSDKSDGGHVKKIKETTEKITTITIKEINNQLKTLKEKTKNKEKHPYLEETFFKKMDSEVISFEKYIKDFEKITIEFYKKFEEVIKEKEEEIKKSILEDKVLNAVNEKFKVGNEYTFDKLMNIVKEGQIRYANDIPPGYEDLDDKAGIQIYGDLIIWKQILEYAKSIKKPIIFVSNDVKPDWIDPLIKETPRFELLKEFNSYTNEYFWSYNISRFLYEINKILDTKLKENVLEEIEEIQIEKEEAFEDNGKVENNDTVRDVVLDYFGEDIKIIDNISIDDNIRMFKKPNLYLAEDTNKNELLIAINLIGGTRYTNLLHPMKNIFELKKQYDNLGKKYQYYLFLIASSKNIADGIVENLEKTLTKKLFQKRVVKVKIGYIADGKIEIIREN